MYDENWYCEFREDDIGTPQVWFGVDLDPCKYLDPYEKLAELALAVLTVIDRRLLTDENIY